MRTLKQKWQYERCYQNAGSLESVRTILRTIANAKSTLEGERLMLDEILVMLGYVNMKYHKEISWETYRKEVEDDN